MYEHRREPLLPRAAFIRRAIKSAYVATLVVALALGIGVLGYHQLEGLSWIDALLNASMILGGMGPVSELHTDWGKLFASAYALFSGIVFITVSGILLAPFLHRFLHRFHLESE
ncbi:MAG: hypothetical protein ACYDDO_08265 [Acidiferrobacterales bacterium]